MASRRPGDKPLSEPRMESLLTHICVTRPQWVNMQMIWCFAVTWKEWDGTVISISAMEPWQLADFCDNKVSWDWGTVILNMAWGSSDRILPTDMRSTGAYYVFCECNHFLMSLITTMTINVTILYVSQLGAVKDRAHLSTFKIFIFENFSCFIVLVVFLVIVQSSELVSVWFCEKMSFFLIFLVTTSLRYMWAGLPWGLRPLAG